MKKVESLTKEQQARFSEFVEKWKAIGLSTEPANREKAEEGIREAYAIAGLKPPRIVWCTSPLAQGITRQIIQKLEADGLLKTGIKIGASVWASVWDSVGASVRASVRASVGDSVWDSVGASVRASVRASVGDSVGASVGASVGDSVRASVWDSVGASVGDSGYGQHDAEWLAFYDFFSEVCGLKDQTKKLHGLNLIAQNAGWFLPHENICWISERHNRCMLDERNRLHSETGMAVQYPDGWGIYALHGVQFKEELYWKIVKKTITSTEALAIQSTDQRAIALQYLGGEKLMADFGGKVIATDEYGELIELPGLLDSNNRPYKYLKAWNPESQSFVYLRTWPDVKTPAEAEAKSYRLERFGMKYSPTSRT